MFRSFLKSFSYITQQDTSEEVLLSLGKLLVNQQSNIKSDCLSDYEFKIFSQFGDDGIIQHLIKNIKIKNRIFIEFGVEDFQESNTRFLLMNNNWSGFIMDASEGAMKAVKANSWFWKYDLRCQSAFITKENINSLIQQSGFEEIGLLHVDIDGNDYWINKELDLSKISPAIIILEYNSVFGRERAVTIPYQANFYRFNAHYSGLYWGASLKALTLLMRERGYSLIGSNSAGNNAYFVRNDLLTETITAKPIEAVYVESKYRESRNEKGQLSFLRGKERLSLIKGLPVINTENMKEEFL